MSGLLKEDPVVKAQNSSECDYVCVTKKSNRVWSVSAVLQAMRNSASGERC